MGGLMKPGEGDLANTANYLASLVGGGINGTYNFPGMIQRGFTSPAYGGNVGIGATNTQNDLLGLGNTLLARYFGGGYAAPGMGEGITQFPWQSPPDVTNPGGPITTPGGPGTLPPAGPPGIPSGPPPDAGTPMPPGSMLPPGDMSVGGGPGSVSNPILFNPSTGLTPGAGASTSSSPSPPVIVPGFDPGQFPGAGGPGYAVSNINGTIGSTGQPGLPGMMIPGQVGGVGGASGLLSRFLGGGSNPGSFDPTIMNLINNPATASLLSLSQGGGVGGGALGSLLQGPGQQFGEIANALNTQRLNNLARTNRDIREQMSVSGLRGSTNYADALGTAATDSEGNMMAELARIIPSITGQDISSKQAGLGALTQAAQSAGGLAGTGANTLASLFQSTQGNNLQQLLASPQALQLLQTLPYTIAGQQQGLAAGDQSLLGTLYGLNEQNRTAADTNAVRQYQEYQRTQSLFPQLLGFLSGTQPQQQQSPFTQATNAATNAGSLYLGAKALK